MIIVTDGKNIIAPERARIEVKRRMSSHDYMFNPDKGRVAGNCHKNNSRDTISLILENGYVQFDYPCQTVSNYYSPKYKYGDTVEVGQFQVVLFVDPRAFLGGIHGIINAFDLEGQPIDKASMQIDNGVTSGRWLIHSRFNTKTGKDDNYGWSGGCFVLSSADLESFNQHLKEANLTKGDVLQAILIEEAGK